MLARSSRQGARTLLIAPWTKALRGSVASHRRRGLKPDRESKLQIATIQAMVKRVLGPHDEGSEADIPPVDQYDCVVVDDCHRGYLLDRELSDRDFLFRDENDYISKYRRVLDHFDAVEIGLTATPALHTKEIFGSPVFSYSYREAVVDGFLVDHEPPTHLHRPMIIASRRRR